MLTYEQLDSIADSVNPILGIVAICAPFIQKEMRAWRLLGWYYAALVVALALNYAVRAFEHTPHGIFSLVGVKFSGHTGFAIVMITSVGWWIPRGLLALIPCFIAYACLMVYQGYHTAADIAVTGGVIAATSCAIQYLAQYLAGRLKNKKRAS